MMMMMMMIKIIIIIITTTTGPKLKAAVKWLVGYYDSFPEYSVTQRPAVMSFFRGLTPFLLVTIAASFFIVLNSSSRRCLRLQRLLAKMA
jgi:hypothetical protein